MFSKWQRKYEDEAERLVEVLRQWYTLESQAKRLEWELVRCQNPEAAQDAAPPEARKPALLRRAEAGKTVVPDKKRGLEQSWKNRHKEVSTFREHYEVNASRLALRVERLAQQVAACKERQKKAARGTGRRAALPTAEAVPATHDAYERMPPALKRMRAQLKKARKEQQPTRPSGSAPEVAVEAAAPQPADQEKPADQESPSVEEEPVEEELVEEEPGTQEAPETPAAAPAQAAHREAAPPVAAAYQALQQEHAALQRALGEAQERLEQATKQVDTRDKELRAAREAADALAQKQTAARQALDAWPVLIKHFRQGQRSFLAQPDAPDVGRELAGLIYYALTHLALALATGEKVRARAMYANLHTLARNLQSYKMTTIHGFDAAFEMLRTLPGGDAAHYAAQLRRSPQTPGAEAQPIRACLKTLRDKASVELRPFFYDLDQEGEVITIG